MTELFDRTSNKEIKSTVIMSLQLSVISLNKEATLIQTELNELSAASRRRIAKNKKLEILVLARKELQTLLFKYQQMEGILTSNAESAVMPRNV